MRTRTSFFLTGTLLLAAAPLSFGQDNSIRANIRGGGGGDGKCTFEVEVDGVAEVEVRGGRGYLRTISGSPASWRRLDCNQQMPDRPNDFRFKGIDGRGRQSLVRDPNSNRGTAVVRLEDPQGGREGYTGDLIWRGGSDGPGNGGNWGGRNDDRGFDRGSDRDFDRGSDRGWDRGWNQGWGNSVEYTGRGSGRFDRDGGPQFDVRGVDVRIDRRAGSVTASFDTDRGRDTVSFEGRLREVNGGDTLVGDIVRGRSRNSSSRANGRMRIQLTPDRRIRTIRMEGQLDGNPFRLDWRD